MSSGAWLAFSRRVLIYVPAYNCAGHVTSVLKGIPDEVWTDSEVLVVDNCSSDGTADKVAAAVHAGAFQGPVTLIRTNENLGYAGSQKLAYRLAIEAPSVERVVMLHGDGQYPPELLNGLKAHFSSQYSVVYGYRDKRRFGDREETPRMAFLTIKLLSALESAVSGYNRKEWHSGFVMYSTGFLRKVNLDALTASRHIDGHLMLAAGALAGPTIGIPIWKSYRGYEAFGGFERIRYVFQVLMMLGRLRFSKSKLVRHGDLQPAAGFKVVASSSPAITGS